MKENLERNKLIFVSYITKHLHITSTTCIQFWQSYYLYCHYENSKSLEFKILVVPHTKQNMSYYQFMVMLTLLINTLLKFYQSETKILVCQSQITIYTLQTKQKNGNKSYKENLEIFRICCFS